MTTSQKASRLREEYIKRSSHSAYYEPMTDEEFERLIERFYDFAENFGFYVNPQDAIDRNGKVIYSFQIEIAKAILRGIFQQRTTEINVAICRQTGKTEFTGLAVGFIFNEFYKVFGAPVGVIIIAPEKGTATVPFRILKKYVDKTLLYDGSATSKRIESVRGDYIELFGIYQGSEGQMAEGRTADLVIRDEAHAGDDEKYSDQVEPTMVTKKSVSVFLGNGGFRKCLFFDRIQEAEKLKKEGNTMNAETNTDCILIRYTYNEIRPYFEKLGEMGLKKCYTQLENMSRNIKKYGGMTSKVVRKNYYCLWDTGFENPVTEERLIMCEDPTWYWVKKKQSDLYVGVDLAGIHDRSVATIIDEKKRIVDWIVIKDANEIKRAREQFQLLYDQCCERGYTANIVSIGLDASSDSTMSVVELCEEEFPGVEIAEYRFSAQKKHTYYTELVESLTTPYKEDRMIFNPLNVHAKQFKIECLEMESKPLEKSRYLHWSAPRREGAFDDYFASAAIANNLRSMDLSVYQGLTQVRKNRLKRRSFTAIDFAKQYIS